MANGYLRLADESAPNGETGANAVSATTFDIPFLEAFIDPKPQYDNPDGEVRGYAGPPPATAVVAYQPEGSIKAVARPSYMGLLLKEACGGVTTTAGNGVITDPDSVAVPAGAYRHVFDWCTGVTPRTFQALFSALTGVHWKAKGNGVETLGFAFEEEVLMLTAALRTLYADTQADPTITPSITTELPFFSGSMTLTWLTGSAVTQDFNFEIRNSLNFFRSFGAVSKYPDTAELGEDMPSQRLGGTISKRALDADDYAALKACTTFAAKIKLTHSQMVTGAYPHQMWVEMPACQYAADWSPEAIKNTRQQPAGFNWEAKYDTATSKWATITLCNATPAYFT